LFLKESLAPKGASGTLGFYAKVTRSSSPFPKREAQFYVASMVLVLEALHSNNVLHRDLKPENFTIDEDGYIKLTDLTSCI
jgi:serine/threonine protein kinase